MTKRISDLQMLYFAKIVERQSYADDLLDGRLYMNTLGHFKAIEDGGTARGDPFEGTSIFLPLHDSTIEINGIAYPPPHTGHVQLASHHVLSRNAYCVFAGYLGEGRPTEIEAESESEAAAQAESFLRLRQECFALGAIAVIVHKPIDFINRVRAAAKRHGCEILHDLVQYREMGQERMVVSDREAPFLKRIEYSHQSEYRIVTDQAQGGGGAFVLNIGSIRDIATATTPTEFNANLRVYFHNPPIMADRAPAA